MLVQSTLKRIFTTSKEQVANIFSKALGKIKFEELRRALGVVNRLFALRGSVKN